MSADEVSFTERAIAFVLAHVNLARLTGGLYLWLLRQADLWIDAEIERLEAAKGGQPTVTVSVTRPPGPTDGEIWSGRA